MNVVKRRKRILRNFLIIIFTILTFIIILACIFAIKSPVKLGYYDLSYSNNYVIVDDRGDNRNRDKYLAHPDLLAINDGNKLVAFYVNGHGRGETIVKTSDDYGLTWSERLNNLPTSFKKTQETPTIFTLNFNNGTKKYLLTSARPGWNSRFMQGEGLDISISNDGLTYSEHKNYFGPNADSETYKWEKGMLNPIVAFSSLHKINQEDAWYGYFHDYDFIIYRVKIHFENDQLVLSKPMKVFSQYRDIEKLRKFSEVQVFKISNSNQMMMLIRTEARNSNSYYAISNDYGETYSEPKELPNHITGDRHKVFFDKNNRILILYRKIDYYSNAFNIKSRSYLYSHGPMMFIANNIDDIINDNHSGYLVKLGHTYSNETGNIEYQANPDTGYFGGYINNQNKLVALTYGRFKSNDRNNTCIVAFNIDLNNLIEDIKNNRIPYKTK
ncbi:Uncharacterised protein [Metamycoplasma cloacale]|uniref:Uncharacterized protein n=1 Tax=Metamycoplasma cloacale TaxID=92401 RepID=A0A2Z4LLV9_9BACT|nr:hypothetical protein [Metamycoplasma cloacale]AWX42674.1 hypothetical protein DK849_01105 [Metamycoplasma cloacale]VEU79514.1 Uncharacterised protein [Metamycoplasma cloacale]